MKTAELCLVLSAHRDWHATNLCPSAGPSQSVAYGQHSNEDLLVEAVACGLSAQEIHMLESIFKEQDEVDIYFILCFTVFEILHTQRVEHVDLFMNNIVVYFNIFSNLHCVNTSLIL